MKIGRRRFLALVATGGGALMVGAKIAEAGRSGVLPPLVKTVEGLAPQRAVDPARMTLHEKKHVPAVILPKRIVAGEPFPVRVTIGEVTHPMVPDHYIEYVELLFNGESAGRVELRPTLNRAVVELTLLAQKPGELVVREMCNLHGLWESSRSVRLT